MKIFVLLLVCYVFFGFASPEELRTHNRENIVTLSIGMSKPTAFTHMGTATAQDFDTEGTYSLTNPYKSEILYSKKATLEIVYYHTELEKRDRQISEKELTPVVFQDNTLIGWGWPFLRQITTRYEITLETQNS